jgi:hypothetical protein
MDDPLRAPSSGVFPRMRCPRERVNSSAHPAAQLGYPLGSPGAYRKGVSFARRVAMITGAILFLTGLGSGWAGGQTINRVPVLGSHNAVPDGGTGWGSYRPHLIFNGGDPSGRAFDISWSRWGSPTVYGRGLNYIFKPKGGYYPKPVRIELRATDLGRCAPGGPSAYTHLEARVPVRPGGPLGSWFPWGSWPNICTGVT